MRGRNRITWAACLLFLLLAAACGPPNRGDDGDDTGPCTEGEHLCEGSTYGVCSGGAFQAQQECPAACDPALGCVTCVPGTGTCMGNTSLVCNQDGTGYDAHTCDDLMGLSCNPGSGLCEGECAASTLGSSYIGCEYYPTVTGNIVGNTFHYAVAVANTSGVDATVTIDRGALPAPDVFTVPAGSVVVRHLPWHDMLKLCSASDWSLCRVATQQAALAPKGAYRLRSNRPVAVYQFNPLEYTLGGLYSYTNDASILLPANVWGRRFVVAGYKLVPSGDASDWPSELVVTALQDGTKVTITTKAATNAWGSVPAFSPGVPQTVTLDAGDVLEIASFGPGGGAMDYDLTGSIVDADKPVQVLGAHYCAYVPDIGIGACDHLEETMLPIETLGYQHVVTRPAAPEAPTGQRAYVRVIAAEPATTLTWDPLPPGAPTTLANAGDWAEVVLDTDVSLTASNKILVAQYMQGQTATSGDPAMTLATPVDQFREYYLFHAPLSYTDNFVTVIAPVGASVSLDNMPVGALAPVGSSGLGVAKVHLTPTVDGNHVITGDMPFGISVYGYGEYTSYWYPGGSDARIVE